MGRSNIVIDMLRMTIVLTVISCAAALLIVFTNTKTADRIAGQKTAAQQAALQRVVPSGAVITEHWRIEPSTGDSLHFWMATAGADTLYAFQLGSRGYSSSIHFLVCVDCAGIIHGVTILDQNETPGLGTRMQEVQSQRYFWSGFNRSHEYTTPWFTEQFKGISINQKIIIEKNRGEWHSLTATARAALTKNNEVTAITGSTISTRAVTNGLNNTAKLYLKTIRG
jgi:Na+-translocating ferredoxin:NAD+ oxidoreductase subunit G